MKKAICLAALASITFGTIFAHSATAPANGTITQTQTDTTKTKKKGKGGKRKMKMKRDSTMKDTTKVMPPKKK